MSPHGRRSARRSSAACGMVPAALLERTRPPARSAPKGRSEAPPAVTPSDRISMAYLMQTLSDLRPPDSVIVEESPSSRRTMQTYLPIDRPNSFFTCASGGLGHSMPAAVGVALAVSSTKKGHRALRRRLVDVFDSGAMVGRRSQAAADHRHREQRRICGAGGVLVALQHQAAHRHEAARDRFRGTGALAGMRGGACRAAAGSRRRR